MRKNAHQALHHVNLLFVDFAGSSKGGLEESGSFAVKETLPAA